MWISSFLSSVYERAYQLMSSWKEVRINGDPINGLNHLLIHGLYIGVTTHLITNL